MANFEFKQRVVGVALKKAGELVQAPVSTASAPTVESVQRPEGLPGITYKIKALGVTYYITISNIVVGEGTPDEKVYPYEIFINSRDMSHFQWVSAMALMLSATFRRGSDPTFLLDQLKQVRDPVGGYYIDGDFMPSIVAHIGHIVQMHLTGLGQPGQGPVTSPEPPKAGADARMTKCPVCSAVAVVQEGGCGVCTACSFSKCG